MRWCGSAPSPQRRLRRLSRRRGRVRARWYGGPVRIAVGSDHAGYGLKRRVVPLLEADGHEVVDVGTRSEDSTDYPLYAERIARLVAAGRAERGVVVCGSGVGVSIAANKVPGVRAVNAHDSHEAELSRRHNDANVVALAGRRLEEADAAGIVRSFLHTDFEGGRHGRRVDQIAQIERRAP
jgi:ribose 5-phosphate isomerase B